jgi:DNA-binding cell septation regulator SpoVG
VKYSIENPKLNDDRRLLMYFALILDDSILVKDMRLLKLPNGKVHVEFPNREACLRCPTCDCKHEYRDIYCRRCGAVHPSGPEERLSVDSSGRVIHHFSVVSPLNPFARDAVTALAWATYEAELAKMEVSAS